MTQFFLLSILMNWWLLSFILLSVPENYYGCQSHTFILDTNKIIVYILWADLISIIILFTQIFNINGRKLSVSLEWLFFYHCWSTSYYRMCIVALNPVFLNLQCHLSFSSAKYMYYYRNWNIPYLDLLYRIININSINDNFTIYKIKS